MNEGKQLRDHLDKLNTILLELRNIDVKIENKDAALILLVYLSQSFENFVQLHHKATSSSSAAGIMANGTSGSKSEDTCNYCK